MRCTDSRQMIFPEKEKTTIVVCHVWPRVQVIAAHVSSIQNIPARQRSKDVEPDCEHGTGLMILPRSVGPEVKRPQPTSIPGSLQKVA